jgi:hypothetical protein
VWRWVALVAVVVSAVACGGSGAGSTPSPSPSRAAVSPTPSGGETVFSLSGVNGSSAGGNIIVTTTPGTLTVELRIFGLKAGSSHVSHIHLGSCQQQAGVAFALNQVIADAQGNDDVKTTLNTTFPPSVGTLYVVVHAGPDLQGTNAAYLLCGNLFK